MRNLPRRLGALMLAGIALNSCSSDSTDDNTGGNRVQALASLAFSPSSIAVHPGDAVTWVFGSVGHNVNFDAVAGAPANITGTNANISIARTFATVGTFPYHCNIHPTMTGTVVVSETTVTLPPPPPPPPPPGYSRAP